MPITTVTCSCGRRVDCPHFTNTCECGADFNTDGTQLADRSQWGEDTGESASDILCGGDPFDDPW